MGQTLRLEVEGFTATDGNGVKTGLMPTELLDLFWPNIEVMLDRLPHTWEGWTKQSLYEAAAAGNIQVWICAKDGQVRFVVFTKIALYPAFRSLEAFWGAGIGMLPHAGPTLEAVLEEFAAAHHCAFFDIVGRQGWEKVVAEWGFRRYATIFRRPVLDRSAH